MATGVFLALTFAFGGAGVLFLFPELPFGVVYLADLVVDPVGYSGVVAAGFVELTPDVGEAGDGAYLYLPGAGAAFDEGVVGAEAVAL